MTRSMADGIGAESAAVIAAGTDIVAVYVTGLGDVPWSGEAVQSIPAGKPVVTIDQGAGNSPRYDATVQDVEPGAYGPYTVPLWQSRCTAERPTVYCDRNDLPMILSTGWRGNLWLAIPGWTEGAPLPSVDGCTVVAVQNQFDVGNTHDLSVVLDPTWPYTHMEPGPIPTPPAQQEVTVQLPLVRQGMTGETVRTVQILCGRRGFFPSNSGSELSPDGIYGPATTNAVRNVQSLHNVVSDGIVGPVTWPILING